MVAELLLGMVSCVYASSGIANSGNVHSHVSRTPQARSRD